MKLKNRQLFRIINLLIKKVFALAALISILMLIPVAAHALLPVTVAWDGNNPVPDGYIIYWSTSSRNYTNSHDVGNATAYTIPDLQEGVTYYFAVTAYDDGDVRNESAYSEEISHTVAIPNSAPTTPSVPSGPASGFIQTDYSFRSTASDPENDTLQYQYNWGDDVISGWGNSTQSHTWSNTGNYCVRARARDVYDTISGWSDCGTIDIVLNTHTIAAFAGAHGSILPSGSVVVSNGGSQTFSITPEQNYRVADVVVDGSSVGSVVTYTFDNVDRNHTIEVSFVLNNQPPISNAGADQTFLVNDAARLDGSASSDVDGDRLTFAWSFVSKPGGSSAVLSDTGVVNPTFEVDVAGTYTVQLIVNDGTVNSSPDTVTVSTENSAPVSNAGADQTVGEGDVVTLSALSSTDVDNNIDGYSWKQKGGTSVEILNPNQAEATFIAPIAVGDTENLTFELTVTDTEDLQDFDDCVVQINRAAVADSDGDGIPDSHDAFPSDPTESTDTDGDGYGNNSDDDDDGDGMTDAWEIANNLEPLVNDADGDPDNDGATNFDEFENRTNPNGFEDHNEPDAPMVLSPLDEAVVSSTPELTVDEFYDPDIDDVHVESQWQIFRADEDSCVFDVTTPSSLNSLKVPNLILDEDTDYKWRMRFINNHDKESQWSEVGTFTTEFVIHDADGNGIPDDQEVDLTTDLDNDGVFDRDQTDIKCVAGSPEDAVQIGISIKNAVNVDSIVSMEIEDPDEATTKIQPKGKPKKLQFGLVNFKIMVNAPGDETEVAIHLSKAAYSNGKLYKYDPINAEWLDYSDFAEFSPNRKVIYLILKDGGFGDADGIENGIIVDPLTVGTDTALDDGSDSGSDSEVDELAESVENLMSNVGCFISTAVPEPEDGGNIWPEIRGRKLAMISLVPMVLLLLITKYRKTTLRSVHSTAIQKYKRRSEKARSRSFLWIPRTRAITPGRNCATSARTPNANHGRGGGTRLGCRDGGYNPGSQLVKLVDISL